jgi:hypothetical protein
MKAYKGTFTKQDGSSRTMRFIKLVDAPSSLISSKITGKQKHTLQPGMELVWDIDANDLRIFNHNKLVDKLEEFEYTLP